MEKQKNKVKKGEEIKTRFTPSRRDKKRDASPCGQISIPRCQEQITNSQREFKTSQEGLLSSTEKCKYLKRG